MTLKINGREKFKLKTLYIFLMYILISVYSLGAVIETNNTSPFVDASFKIAIRFENEKSDDYVIKGIEDFHIINKQQRKSVSIRNQKRTTIVEDIYELFPLKAGALSLGISINGVPVSKELKLQVQESLEEDKKIFLISNQYERDYYLGEKIPYTEKLVLTTNINYYNYTSESIFEDILKENIMSTDKKNYGNGKRVVEDNKARLELYLESTIIQGTSVGEKNIRNGKVIYTTNSNSAYKSVGGEERTIKFKPIPQENKPENFKNVIGELKGKIFWGDDNNLKVGDPITLKVELFGEVNLDSLQSIVENKYSDFNVYESLVESSEDIINEKYMGKKVFEIAFIPKKSGILKTPEIKIPYFDPILKEYKEYVIESREIEVENDILGVTTSTNQNNYSNTNSSSNSPIEKVTINIIPETKEVNKINYTLLFIAGGIIIIQGVIIGQLFYKNKKIKNGEVDYKKILDKMEKSKSDKEFYNLYCEYMKEKYNFSPKSQIGNLIIKTGGTEEIVEINRYLEECRFKNIEIDKKKVVGVLKEN